jgi:hypothetical protein
LSLATYLRCFAAVELMQDNRHRISMALTRALAGAFLFLSLYRFLRIRCYEKSTG